MTRQILCWAVFGLLSAAIGCDHVGPPTLEQSRVDYNQVIQETSKSQTFLNIIRVYNFEPTTFMDVSEVDVGLQWQNSISATAMLPQAKTGSGSVAVSTGGSNNGQIVSTSGIPLFTGHDFGLTGGLQFQVTPTIRYQPLLGQPLIAQTATPITVYSLQSTLQSEWPLAAVFPFALYRITHEDADFYPALNALIRLDALNALLVSTTKSGQSGGDQSNSSTSAGNATDDTLVIYCALNRILDDSHKISKLRRAEAKLLWHRLWIIYADTQLEGVCETDYQIQLRASAASPRAAPAPSGPVANATVNSIVIAPPAPPVAVPVPLPPCPPPVAIVPPALATLPDWPYDPYTPTDKLTATAKTRAMPVLESHSAMGILRAITHEDWDLAVFVSAGQFEKHLRSMVERFDKLDPSYNIRRFYVFDVNSVLNDDQTTTSVRSQRKLVAPTIHPRTVSDREKYASWLEQFAQAKSASKYLTADEIEALSDQATWINDQHRPHDDLNVVDYTSREPQEHGEFLEKPHQGGLQDWEDDQDVADESNRDRHFLIIVYQDDNVSPPSDSYVLAHCDHKIWWIDGKDDVSKRNFLLVSHFLTVQATPAQGGQLTPTIGVGGGGH